MKTNPARRQDTTIRARYLWILTSIILCFTFILSSCTRNDISQNSASTPTGTIKESWNVQILLSQGSSDSDESLPRLNISADHVQWVGEGDSIIQHLNGIERKVEIEIFDSTGVISALLEADHVSYYENEEYFIAEGGVKIETRDDRILNTEWVEWWESDQMLRSDQFVNIHTPKEVLSGIGLEATEDLSSYQIGKFQAKIISDP